MCPEKGGRAIQESLLGGFERKETPTKEMIDILANQRTTPNPIASFHSIFFLMRQMQ